MGPLCYVCRQPAVRGIVERPIRLLGLPEHGSRASPPPAMDVHRANPSIGVAHRPTRMTKRLIALVALLAVSVVMLWVSCGSLTYTS
jgi:hypothetical protein